MNNQTKIVVFDLDETLGYFEELGMFWNGINSYIKTKNIILNSDQLFFNKLLDLYPEFIRPNIILILNYLKKKKIECNCNKIIIYTNNQGPRDWGIMIKNYFDTKLKYKLFDQIIGAFKINGKQIELCRTTYLKTHKDLIKCIKLPETTKICFLDDVLHPEMKHPNVYYINIKPYTYGLSFDILINRFLNSSLITEKWGEPTLIKEYLLDYFNNYNYKYVEKQKKEVTIDKIISKKILQHLHIFFCKDEYPSSSCNKTKNNRAIKNKLIKNKTIKIKK
jgi:hypothetical protein